MMKGFIRVVHVLLLATWSQQLPCILASELRVTAVEEYGEGVLPIDNEMMDKVVGVEYNPRKYFAIKNSATGKALDVPFGLCNDSTQLIVWDYHGLDNQLFYFGPNDTIVSKLCNKVIDIQGGLCVPGARLILWPAHGRANQVFKSHADGRINNPRCNLAVSMPLHAKNGDGVVVWNWYGTSEQKWEILPRFFVLKNPESGKVIDIPFGNCRDSTELIVWDYNGGDNQLFYFGPNDTIVSKLCNKVIDIQGGLCVAGAKLILWPAHGRANQVFKRHADGRINNPGCNLAVSVPPHAQNGNSVVVWKWYGGSNQIWKSKKAENVIQME